MKKGGVSDNTLALIIHVFKVSLNIHSKVVCNSTMSATCQDSFMRFIKSQDHKAKSKLQIPGLVPVNYESGFVYK